MEDYTELEKRIKSYISNIEIQKLKDIIKDESVPNELRVNA